MIPKRDIFAEYRVINKKPYLSLNNEIFELDDMGDFIWQLINGKNSIDDITRIIVEKYNVDEEMVKADVNEFINQLKDNDLVLL